MKFHLSELTLQCKRSREVISFAPQATVFHGQISAGKSSVARLIDFCFGGDLERTPAIAAELVRVSLIARIGQYEVLFERDAVGSNQVQVTWQDELGDRASVSAPLVVPSEVPPIWSDNVFNLSDLIFFLAGLAPMRVRRSKRDSDSPLVRLSFRDLLWYCYLEQDHLDSSFYKLMEPFRELKSRDVMRFVVGFYTDRMNDLEARLVDLTDEKNGKIQAVEKIREFLKQFGYDSERAISMESARARDELRATEAELEGVRNAHSNKTHFADDLRSILRDLGTRLDQERQTLADQTLRIDEQKTLRSELLATKFKLARATAAANVLAGANFEVCPSCGQKLREDFRNFDNHCDLCGQERVSSTEQLSGQAEATDRDLDARTKELDSSIARLEAARRRQDQIVSDVESKKMALDRKLTEELVHYDSEYLSRARETERRAAALQERIRGLEQLARMPAAVEQLQRDVEALTREEDALRSEIRSERDSLKDADRRVSAVEQSFREALVTVGVPGVDTGDLVEINRQTWLPYVLPRGDEHQRWNFYNAGSGGKKTLFNVCYALAVHKVAAEHNLPLPTFLIIDSPMKNIGDDVNRDLFQSFYRYLYGLARGSLAGTQFIIIDNEYIRPEGEGIEVLDRYMTRDDPAFPPLISYYRGP